MLNKKNIFCIHIKSAAALLILSFYFFSCGVNEDSYIQINPALIGKGDLYGAGQEGIQQQNTVISDTAVWNELKNKMDSVNNVTGSFTETEINFSEYLIIAAFSDLRPIGGCSIEIKNVVESSESINITIENIIPETGTAVETQPYHIVKIPRTAKQIVFN